ncbi:unnamed protein product [Miscanthus lutarioriparius]|uniref:DUF1618 domain-containing protein n=1 Tax=Miscanthus lutarioriparius TaxID=422564 RepID=A0A811N0C3_9POAL|nr:unnamed protein product [Miscanthus lutarioriparius]
MFCFQGQLFWADFAQGLMYCDLRAGDAFELTESPKKRRTIGYIEMVKLWTLDMDRCAWKEHRRGFPCPWMLALLREMCCHSPLS